MESGTDLTTFFLSSIGVRNKTFKISSKLLEGRLKNFEKGEIISLPDLLSFHEYSKLSFEDKAAAGRKLRELADKGKLTLLSVKYEGRNRYKV